MENHYFGCKLSSEIIYKIKRMQYICNLKLHCYLHLKWYLQSCLHFSWNENYTFCYHLEKSLVQFSIYLKKQQTPNPEAQFPDAMPPLLEHSSAVKQTPYIVVVVSMFVWHCMLSNDTTENSEKAPVQKQIILRKFTNKL